MQMASMNRVEGSAQYSNLCDGISPGLSEEQERVEMKEFQKQIDQRKLAMQVRGAR
jgi:hypothetical protein